MARKYPIIGGELNGDAANEADFKPDLFAMRDYGRYRQAQLMRPGGQFGRWADQYVGYNRANGFDKVPTRIWLHKSMLAGN